MVRFSFIKVRKILSRKFLRGCLRKAYWVVVGVRWIMWSAEVFSSRREPSRTMEIRRSMMAWLKVRVLRMKAKFIC